MVQTRPKIALLHRHPPEQIPETNAAFSYLKDKGIDVLSFKKFDRKHWWRAIIKSAAWLIYAPCLVAGKGYDVIYCDDSFPFYPILVKLISPKSKIILRLGDFHLMYHTVGLIYRLLHVIERIGWHLADGIICISHVMAWRVKQETKTPILVVLDPVDLSQFKPNGTASEGYVMFHGTLTRNKGIDILLQAARKLPSLCFIIVGTGPDEARLKRLAPQNVVFAGWQPHRQIAHSIARCAVGVALRSDNPGNDYVVTSPFLQYGAMGRPCLVTKRKVFADYFWQFSNVYELIEELKALLGDADFCREEGKLLRQYVMENHDAEKIAGEIWQHLTSVSLS